MNNTTSTRQCLCLALLSPFFLFACSGGGGSNADTTAPTVSTTTPANAATAVARNSSLTATFNEDIFAVTVDAASFTLATAGAGNTAGSVTFDGASNVASFTPNSPLATLATYTATLGTAITDLSGNPLAANYSWSFTTADGAWGSNPTLIETNNVGNAFDQKIAVDSNGNALAVWVRFDGARINIWANRFNGTLWGTAELIEGGNAGSAVNPQIAIGRNSNAFAVWAQDDGIRNNIWANRFDGTHWEGAELIEADNAGGAIRPQIAVDRNSYARNGNALAVWAQDDGIRNNIWANRFNGANWGTAELIEGDNAGSAVNPQIAFGSNGNAFAVWAQDDGIRNNIWANRFDGTNWGAAELIETNNAGTASFPKIAVDSNGNALAVWQQSDGTRNIWANRFDGTNWGEAERIETNNAGNASLPQVAFDSNGNALAVWQQSDGIRTNIWANYFDGVNWGTAERIETDNAGFAFEPQIAFDRNGNALAVWQQSDGTRSNIWANRFNGTNWGTAELIEGNNAGRALNPQIAVDSNGNALAVWNQFDGTHFNIWANRFE